MRDPRGKHTYLLGYNTYLLGNLFVYPSFARKYGSYFEDKGWVVTTGWQVALTDVTIAGQVTGLLLMGWLTDRFGHRLVIMGGMIAMVGLNFITVFAPNVQILCVAMALNGVPNGVFGILGSAYASEVAPLALRGFLTSFVNICWIIGRYLEDRTEHLLTFCRPVCRWRRAQRTGQQRNGLGFPYPLRSPVDVDPAYFHHRVVRS